MLKITSIMMQVVLVTGGWNNNDGLQDSTEVMEAGGTWRLTAPLPSARHGLRAASVANYIFVFGENIIDMFVSSNCPGLCLGQSVSHSVSSKVPSDWSTK